MFINIIEMAIRVLELLIMQVINLVKKFDVKADESQVKLETLPSVRQSDRQREAKEVLEKIPTKPKKSARERDLCEVTTTE